MTTGESKLVWLVVASLAAGVSAGAAIGFSIGRDVGEESMARRVEYTRDQCAMTVAFTQCLTSVPEGPERLTGPNDWDEVVEQCEDASWALSVRHSTSVSPECRGRSWLEEVR